MSKFRCPNPQKCGLKGQFHYRADACKIKNSKNVRSKVSAAYNGRPIAPLSSVRKEDPEKLKFMNHLSSRLQNMDTSKALNFAGELKRSPKNIDDEALHLNAVAQELSSRVPEDRVESFEREFKSKGAYKELQEDLSKKSVPDLVMIMSDLEMYAEDNKDALKVQAIVDEIEARQFNR